MQKKEKLQELASLVQYLPFDGVVLKKSSSAPLVPDLDGSVSLYNPSTKKVHKIKLNKLILFISSGRILQDGEKILHRNMQEDDFRIQNLEVVDEDVYNQIREAYKNISYGIQVSMHRTDKLAYNLQWYEDGVKRNRVVYDSSVANRMQVKLKLKYSKILTKYCVFD